MTPSWLVMVMTPSTPVPAMTRSRQETETIITGGEGAGDDSYDGGTGIDTIKYTSATDDIVIDLSKGLAGSKNGGNKAGIGSDTSRALRV